MIVVAVVFVCCLVLRWYYLKAARDIKRLEALGEAYFDTRLYYNCLLYSPQSNIFSFITYNARTAYHPILLNAREINDSILHLPEQEHTGLILIRCS